VAKLSVANKINDDIMVELLSVIGSNLEDLRDIVTAITVDVEYRRIDRLGKVCAILSTSSFLGSSGKTNLVIDNHMDGAANTVVGEVLHLHGFIDHSLACK